MVESRLLQEDVVSVIFDTEKKGTAQAEGDDSSRKTSVESTAALTAASSFDENDLLPGRKISNSVLDSVEDCPSDDQEVETENKSSRRELQHCSSLMTLTKLSLDQHTIKEHFVTGSSVITANTGTNNKAQENIFLASVGESRKSVGDCNFVASTTRTTATVGSTAINTLGISTSSASLLRGAGTDTKGEAKSRFKDDSEHQEEAAPVESRVRFIKEVAVETERSVQSGAQVAHQRITKEEEQRRRQVILETGQKAQCAFPSSEAPPPIGLRISAQAMHPQNQGGTHTRGYHGQPQHQQRNTPRGHSDNLSISSDGHRLTMGSFRAGSMGGRDGAHSIDSTGVPPPTPLFDRLLSEEVQEMKLYAKIIKDQNQRLAELEDIHHNLEARLEMQTRERMELEEKLSENERKWEMRCAELEKERDDALKNVEMEKSANKGLLEHVSRTNKEMQRRKYGTGPQRHPHQRENLRPRGGESDIRRVPSAERGVSARELSPTLQHAKMNKKSNLHESPHELLASSGNTEAVQQRNVTNSLLDFFGITEPNSSS
eukprot:CAMPEP_0198306710 /NCGR_PEP_ID=MMETSP1449-20131203/58553_1 /TAXON_ID=420275 /ORGANISM="Attheya septentrionalis, Strain CCMP2084" /LENGTH=545 /DNA_ID=CAMNT_0044009267 /DNA_START=195 /DNA_END=1832 /DNA_ORIENTATION=+